MTDEERLAHVETTVANHQVQLDLLIGIAERQTTLLEELQAQTVEIKQDTAMTRRLWIHLARKHGWLDDDDWPPPPNKE
jgi:hypothetical protein